MSAMVSPPENLPGPYVLLLLDAIGRGPICWTAAAQPVLVRLGPALRATGTNVSRNWSQRPSASASTLMSVIPGTPWRASTSEQALAPGGRPLPAACHPEYVVLTARTPFIWLGEKCLENRSVVSP